MEGKRNFRPNTLVLSLKPKQPKLRAHHDLPHPHHRSHDLSHRLPVLSSLHLAQHTSRWPRAKTRRMMKKMKKQLLNLWKANYYNFLTRLIGKSLSLNLVSFSTDYGPIKTNSISLITWLHHFTVDQSQKTWRPERITSSILPSPRLQRKTRTLNSK